MPRYRRHYLVGGTYFFTVVTYRRQRIFDAESVDILREAFRYCLSKKPFTIDAIVILPDHIHAIWTLPHHDHDFSSRWKSIKTFFTKEYQRRIGDCRETDCKTSRQPPDLPRSMRKKGEKGLWQRRFWEHAIRDENDYRLHMDYLHWNPVKHKLVGAVVDWPYSSFHRLVSKGIYPISWAGRADGFPEPIGGE